MLTLLYHNVLRDSAHGLPVAGHQVRLETFRRQIRRFRDDILHPLDIHDDLQRGKIPRGVLITFDDGAAGIEDAAKVLGEMGKAGVAFICPGSLANGLWFYRLADMLVRGTVPFLRWRDFNLSLGHASARRLAYKALSQVLFDWAPAVRDEALLEIEVKARVVGERAHPALTTFDEDGLVRVSKTGGLIFANHSWSHPNLVKLSANELTHEVEAAQSWLQSSGLPIVPWFAFPRGVYDARVNKFVAQYCPVTFGASVREAGAGVLPRTYIQQADSNQIRFAAKTAFAGRFRQMVFWR